MQKRLKIHKNTEKLYSWKYDFGYKYGIKWVGITGKWYHDKLKKWFPIVNYKTKNELYKIMLGEESEKDEISKGP